MSVNLIYTFQMVVGGFGILALIGMLLSALVLMNGNFEVYRSARIRCFIFGAMFLSSTILFAVAFSLPRSTIFIQKSAIDQAASGMGSDMVLSLTIFFIIYWLFGREKSR